MCLGALANPVLARLCRSERERQRQGTSDKLFGRLSALLRAQWSVYVDTSPRSLRARCVYDLLRCGRERCAMGVSQTLTKYFPV